VRIPPQGLALHTALVTPGLFSEELYSLGSRGGATSRLGFSQRFRKLSQMRQDLRVCWGVQTSCVQAWTWVQRVTVRTFVVRVWVPSWLGLASGATLPPCVLRAPRVLKP